MSVKGVRAEAPSIEVSGPHPPLGKAVLGDWRDANTLGGARFGPSQRLCASRRWTPGLNGYHRTVYSDNTNGDARRFILMIVGNAKVRQHILLLRGHRDTAPQ